jgi:hypothetical protein
VIPDAVTDRRGYGAALALLSLGGVLLLVGFGLTWARATVTLAAVDNATKEVALSGRDLLPGAAASGWIALAGIAGLVATRSWGRSVVAVIVLIAGLTGSAAAIAFAARPSGFIGSLTASVSASRNPGWLVALAGGLCTIAAAAWALARGRRWATMGARYHRAAPESTRSTWDLQDMGQDPTDDLVE